MSVESLQPAIWYKQVKDQWLIMTKKTFQKEYLVGDKVLLKVKNFLDKNAKLAEKWKGPFVITYLGGGANHK